MKEKYYILSCSFGKDSLYLLNYLLENKYPLNEVQFVEPMFDKNISGIIPEHKKFIDDVIKKFKNVNFNIIKSEANYSELYIKYGCPTFKSCHWCTGWLKTKPLNKYNKQLKEKYDVYFYIGLCANEKERVLKNKNKKNIYPLYENNITEDTCLNWCKKNNLLSPTYTNKTNRDGCWFCPFRTKMQWYLLKLDYPNLFKKMTELEQKRIDLGFKKYNLVRTKPLKEYINYYLQLSIYDFMED